MAFGSSEGGSVCGGGSGSRSGGSAGGSGGLIGSCDGGAGGSLTGAGLGSAGLGGGGTGCGLDINPVTANLAPRSFFRLTDHLVEPSMRASLAVTRLRQLARD
jgi:hypothetical protein